MKKNIILLASLLIGTLCVAVIGSKSQDPENPKSERREVRETRRATRQAEMEHQIDSMMLVKRWIFRPQSIQREPAGRMQFLNNPQFEVRVWGNSADVFLPYIKGITPPYRHTIINYTLPFLNDYVAVQGDNGWSVTFKSSLLSASEYTFKFEVNSKFGTTMLTLSNPWENDVTYSGILTRIY